MDDQRRRFQLRPRVHPACLDDRHFPPIAVHAASCRGGFLIATMRYLRR
ncbi:hypothetical protein RHECNPAF_280022 [Rhizobium etli CNPAF512]|nr:hypothetical protein RHECNPAF_280022 [Rhizobium etli CNPAF512]